MQREHSFSLPTGYLLHEYRIERVLGHGGFGVTYLARDQHLNALVAIKEFLPQEFAVRDSTQTVGPRSRGDADSYVWGLDRFKQEARALARFKHPHIVRATRLIEANGTAYMVMDFEHGMTLKEFQQRAGRTLNEGQLLGVFLPILDGLHELHSTGLIHRDIKPGNIYLRARGGPMLIDFGAVRQAVGSTSQALTSLVTPGYAPLEQYSGDARQGPWSDLYAVGATMYACMMGRAPTDAARRSAALQEGEPDPHVPAVAAGAGRYSPSILEAVDWALSLRSKERPQDATEFAARLRESAVQPVTVVPEVAPEIEVPTQVASGAPSRPVTGASAGDQATLLATAYAPTQVLDPTAGGRPRFLARVDWNLWRARGAAFAAGLAARSRALRRPTPRELAYAGGALAAAAALIVVAQYVRVMRDEAHYRAAAELGTVAAYRGYLANCGVCAHRLEAEAALAVATEFALPSTEGAKLAVTAEPAPSARTPATPPRGAAPAAARAKPPAAGAAAADKSAPAPVAAAPKKSARIASGTVFRDSLGEAGQGPELVMLDGGTFRMGDPTSTMADAQPVHSVRIAPFALGVREVTRGEFAAFVEAVDYKTDAQRGGGCRVTRRGASVRDRWSHWRRAPFSQSDDHPVLCVSWNDAQAYVAWLAKLTRRAYRLPTEAEWEYAARAGGAGTFWWGEEAEAGKANCDGCGRGSRMRTLTSDSFEPNAWGLRDTAGNLWEWTCSAYERRYAGSETRCAAASSLGERSMRGGSWAHGPDRARSALRASAPADLAADTVGFRVALDP